jgi:hypothetical protein
MVELHGQIFFHKSYQLTNLWNNNIFQFMGKRIERFQENVIGFNPCYYIIY